jgi:aspartate/methionine/tyrosine aminotransferase
LDRDNILITGGASAGLNVALQKVTWPGYTRRVFMVAPTYYLAAGSFIGICLLLLSYCKIVDIPSDSRGSQRMTRVLI